MVATSTCAHPWGKAALRRRLFVWGSFCRWSWSKLAAKQLRSLELGGVGGGNFHLTFRPRLATGRRYSPTRPDQRRARREADPGVVGG